MSRFAVVHEDPEFEEPVMAESWFDVLDGFVSVAEKPQEEEEIPYYGA